MYVLALAGQKGGVGKSTVALSLAVEAMARGRRVLLVDADPQGTIRTWAEVAGENERDAPSVVSMGATMHRPDQLPKIGAGFDLIVVDCPPRGGDVQRSAMMVADRVLLPCGPSATEAWALASTLETITEARTIRPDLEALILITRKQPRTAIGKAAREVLEQSELPVLRSELSYRVAYQEAIAAGMGVTTYQPSSEAAQEMRSLFQELFGKETRHGRKKAPKAEGRAAKTASG